MPWVEERREHDYCFLRSGELEFRGRGGRYHIASGCSVTGIFELEDRLEEIRAIANDAPNELTIDDLYREHQRFQYLCNRILELNGIALDWVTPREMSWLIFHRREGEEIIEAPLQTLNRPPKPRHPSSEKGNSSKTDRVTLIAAIASHCGGNLELAYQVAMAKPFREVMGVLEESSWQRKTPEERRKAEFKNWAKDQRAKARAKYRAAPQAQSPRNPRHEAPLQ
ncbi:MAG: hypothetical protein AAFN08_10840 [Cyanobacteria bacterium J06559_3]